MKILVLGTTREDTAAGSIASALSLAHEVTNFDYERGLRLLPGRFSRFDAAYGLALKALRRPPTFLSDRRLLDFAEGRRFDLLFVVAVTLVPPEVVRAFCDKTGALAVGWFTDHIVNIQGAEFIRAPYARIFFKDKVVVDRFRRALASETFDYLPQAFDPELHRPVSARLAPEGADADIATFGNSYTFRAALMAPLLAQRDIRSVIYGRLSWQADPELRRIYKAPVFNHQKSAAMRAAKIALNTNHFAELGGVNKRSFELGGIGAFQLTDGPNIAEYFEPERECAVFHGPQELVERARHYLARPEERAEIAQRGLLRAYREHTYQHRLNELFERVPALSGAARLPTPKGPPEPEAEVHWSSGELPTRRLVVA